MTRSEWVKQFKARLGNQLQIEGAELDGVCESALDSWLDHKERGPFLDRDWREEDPETAADIQVENWSES